MFENAMKYTKYNSFIEYFNKLYKKWEGKKGENCITIIWVYPKRSYHPPNYQLYALFNL